MKRFLAFAACAAVAASLTGTAHAASFKGIVVAKDAKRKALVTASPGAVRTVRAPGKFGAFRIGQRVVVVASPRADGTFTARTLRPAGRSKQVRFSAVIVQTASSRLIVTAGGSVFAFGLTRVNTASLSEDHPFEPGDKVDVDADVKGDHVEAGTGDVDKTGHVESLVLEGIFLFTKGDGFDLAVVHHGLVHVSVPTGMVLPAFKAGDQIVVVVTVSAAGKLSFVKGQGEGHATPPPAGEAYAYGPLTERSAFSVGVKRENGELLRCGVPSGLDLSIFRIGEKVKLYCGTREGHLVLKKMASDHASVTGDGTGEFLAEGTLTEASAEGATLSIDGSSIRCLNRAHLDLGPFVLGERALMGCRLADHEYRLFKLHNSRATVYAGDTTSDVVVYGVVAERSTSLVVRRDDGSSKACSVPTGMDLQGFRIGDRVKMHCHLAGSSFGLVDVSSENAFARTDGSGELTAYGTVHYKNGDGIAVQREDHSIVTCGFPPSTNLDAFPIGTRVKIHCHRHGSYRLAELQSETDHLILEP